ncbi:MAG: Asp23/Gls24 family envelope stress response protein [Gordonia sp. (in: high G+C Gram-positive bacteria)]|uniref:Asp23/Gls24 family envelope stress response protein n=1 Tax=Gordonia sp. (in: high G+C Gram-positive bacteria) TaxID=84139 RepID=UPI0039E46611
MSERTTPTVDDAPSTASASIDTVIPAAGATNKEIVRRDQGDGRGRTVIADTVVAKIAGVATREINGVHDLGGTGERMVGKMRDFVPGTSSNVTQGIDVEVGEKQAAVDVQIIAEYGVPIHQLADAIRRNVVSAIEQMTGLEVTEVNVTVHDVHLPETTTPQNDPAQPPRVQ